MSMTPDPEASIDDDAARAAWLYYVGGLTQDQIAREMDISRQRAQRLVSRAMTAGMIHVRLNHRLAPCLALEAELTARFGLWRCRVAPSLGAGGDPVKAIAPAAAAEMERVLRRPEPLVIAVGTGRAMRAMVEAMGVVDAPRHRLVSLIGNIAPDGSASYFDVIMRLAEKVNARHYPMPVPVLSSSTEENAAFQSLPPVRIVRELAASANVTFVGVGQMTENAPLLTDGFLTQGELSDVQRKGATGEVAGWIYDRQGEYLDLDLNSRVGGVRVFASAERPVIAAAAGLQKVAAIRAALTSGIINGLVTDEDTARAILSP